MKEILDLLRDLGWQEGTSYGNERYFLSWDGEYSVDLISHLGWWTLGKFTDSDIDGVAVGRYRHLEDGGTLEELQAALREIPIASLLRLTGQPAAKDLALLAKAGCTPEQARAYLKVEGVTR